MKRISTIREASEVTGLSEYSLRLGIKQGRIPFIRTSGSRGKIFIDLSLLEQTLQQEAIKNASVEGQTIERYGEIKEVKI